MMKKRGADYVLGVDASDRSIGQARFLAELHNVDVDFRLEDVYRFCLNNREVFDYVLFMGLFYHLRHPLLVLDHVAAVTRELMYFQCEVRGPRCLGKLTVQDDYAYDENAVFRHEEFPKMFFIEKLYNSDPSNWWLPNEAGLLAVVRSAGFEIVGQPSREILVCKPGRRPVWVDICDHVSIPLVVKRVAYQ
jgi:tRNA (mo5U34)-methyltransferase